jgi:hypothetical protein
MVATERPADHVLKFGKHAGKRLGDVPSDYLSWLSSCPAAKPGLRAMARHVLEHGDQPDDGADPDRRSAAVRFPLVCFKFEQHMDAEFGDDPASMEVVRAAKAKLRALCSEVTGRRWPTDAECGFTAG